MFEVIVGLLTKPIYTILGVLILWPLVYFSLWKVFKIKDQTWIRLEYLWILVGLIGLIILVDENRKTRSSNELLYFEIQIEGDLKSLLNYSQISNHCFKYKNSGILPQEEFDKRQAEQDTICAWMAQIKGLVERSLSNNNSKLDEIPTLNIRDYQNSMEYEHVHTWHQRINELIEKINKLKKIVNNDFWNSYKYTFGILLMIFAFAIRLSLVSHKINKSKTAIKGE